MSLTEEVANCKVSSVLNNDRKQFGKKYIFDGNDETCWNSDQGLPQWIQFGFASPRKLSKLKLQFQGGFVGKHCLLETIDTAEAGASRFEFFPGDTNSLQVFSCDVPLISQNFKLSFLSSTDFYGRIIVYQLQVFDS